MNFETVVPENEQAWLELRCKDLTSSDMGALFGFSTFSTAFELWHRKKAAKVVEWEGNEFTRWGQRLQDSIAAGVAEDEGWNIRRMNEYMRIPELRLGSSFDFSIQELVEGGMHNQRRDVGLLEIKNVFGMKFAEEWLKDDDGNIEAPPQIEIQVQHQLLCSGRAFSYIAALVGGNKLVLIKRTPDLAVFEAIKKKAAEFWASIEANTPPDPNYVEDLDFIKSLYGYSEPGKIITADAHMADLAQVYKSAMEAEKAAKKSKETVKAEILTIIGDAEKVLGDGFSVSAGMVAPAEIEAYTRKGYRLFKVNFPRGKKK